MRRLPLWAQGEVGKAGEAAALAGALEVSPQLPKFCARYPSQAAAVTGGMSKCTGQYEAYGGRSVPKLGTNVIANGILE